MNFCISGLLAAFSVSFLLGSAESLAQNAYITNYSDGTVSVIDTATNAVTGSGATGSCLGQYFCNGIAVTPDGSKVYVGNRGLSSVSAINVATNAVTASIPVGAFPFGIAVTPDSRKVYVATTTKTAVFPPPTSPPDTVSVIDTATNKVIATITVGGNLLGLAVTPDGSKVYVVANAAAGNARQRTGHAIPSGRAAIL